MRVKTLGISEEAVIPAYSDPLASRVPGEEHVVVALSQRQSRSRNESGHGARGVAHKHICLGIVDEEHGMLLTSN